MDIKNKPGSTIHFLSRTLAVTIMTFFIFLFIGALDAQGQNYYFNGTGNNNDWDNPNNWMNKEIPKTGFNIKVVIGASTVCKFSLHSIEIGALIIKGELTINNGSTLKIKMFDIGPNGSLNNNGILELRGSVSIAGKMTGEGYIILNSTESVQTFSIGNNRFYNLVIDNPFGVIMKNKWTVDGKLTLNSGTINTNGNILELTSEKGTNLTGYSINSFIITTSAAGALRRHIGTNNDTYVFPVGLSTTASDYYKMELENNNLAGMTYLDVYIVRNNGTGYNHSQYGKATQDGIPLIYYCNEEWIMNPDVEPTSGSFALTLHLANLKVGWGGGLLDNQFTIVKRPSASQSFADYDSFDGSTLRPTAGEDGRTVTSGYAYKKGFTSFSKATVVGSNDPLPIDLLSFEAKSNDGAVELAWTTASEINNDFFTVERSRDGIDFATVLKKQGAGSSNQMLDYSLTDESPYKGLSYYRLKQTDYDGKNEYSKIIAVNIIVTSILYAFPNPSKDQININLDDSFKDVQVLVETISGQQVLVLDRYFNGQTLTVDIKDIKPGLYLLRLSSQEKNQTIKFIKAK
ncbi:MAG TPA: T9SS type A sorting domain-containing protein [Flavobacteriales bacterium]|nr:T9SS type A sorting domain-containing protein [Flavobacteriales bacterium]